MRKIMLLVVILLFSSLVVAQEVKVVKEAVNEIKFNEILEVKISVSNPTGIEKEFEITEKLPQGVVLVEPNYADNIEMHNGIEVRYFEWVIKVPAEKVSSLSYKIRPDQLGDYTISPTTIRDRSGGGIYLSQSLSFFVSCVFNNVCEEGESFFTCPQDCKSGAKDGICVYEADDICDPDCSSEPDCEGVFNSSYLLIGSVLVIVIILGLILIFVIKKIGKKKEQDSFKEQIGQ